MNRRGTEQERHGHSFPYSLNLLLLSLLLAFSANAVWAQDDADTDEEEEEEPVELGRVEVTGSLLRREEFTSTSPVQIINAETQAQVGQLSVADILQSSTVAAGTTQLNNQFNGFVIQGGTGVQTLDLRGLGDNRTLVILNGRRPGGSGTRGQVQALDLATIPEIAAQRFEIVLDGSSSIYGSDAIAGVANIITRRSVDRTEVQALTDMPTDSGGELYRVSGITGLNFEKGAVTLSAQWELREELTIADRDFLSCGEDLVTDASGNRIDREDRSITAGTPLSGCNNLYANTFIDAFTGARYIPSPDGVTIGNFPGYRPRVNPTYANSDQAAYEDVLNFDFAGSTHAINRLERVNIYATADYSFDFWGGVDWDADFLYSRRDTEAENWRQFFPLVSSSDFIPYPGDPTFHPGLAASQPVMPYPSNTDVTVDFFYFTTGLEGVLPTRNFWSWQVYGSYSYSDGDYTRNSILNSQSGDIRFDDNPPRIDYFDPAILSGENMQALIDTVGIVQTGNTTYEQYQVVGILAGDLFSLPAGMVGTAIGLEYRDFSIDDQPSEASRSGDLWGETSALVTKGSNSVVEVFGEVEIPILAGLPAIESLTLNLSARAFDYDVGGSDSVWKAGLKWNVTPSFMLRSTAGTSYRAPALFEQFLGNQTGFLGQLGNDPCIDWGNSSNELIRRNCAADGIPPDYTGAGSSILVISGGNADSLESETSDAFTAGFVLTPQVTDLSIAVDYFDFEVNDQITQLGAGAILSGCYNAENFPNAFCDLFTRRTGDPQFPLNVAEVQDTFVNINEQRVKGIDLNLRWNQGFAIGNLVVEAQSTWVLENISRLFDPSQVQGFEEDDVAGQVGSPEHVANLRATLERNDWSYNYYLQYVSETDDLDLGSEEITYFGFQNARRDLTMDAAFFHSISVYYEREKWDFLVGINNLFDEEPDVYSSGAFRNRRGNVPISATQYDYLGRRFFLRFTWRM
jgi:iron complex outermembrane receptor protein